MGSSSDPILPASAPLSSLLRILDREVAGQEPAKRALWVAAVADRSLWIEGPPGCGKTRLVRAWARACGNAFPLHVGRTSRAARESGRLQRILDIPEALPAVQGGSGVSVSVVLHTASGASRGALLVPERAASAPVDPEHGRRASAPVELEDAELERLRQRYPLRVRMSALTANDPASARRLLAAAAAAGDGFQRTGIQSESESREAHAELERGVLSAFDAASTIAQLRRRLPQVHLPAELRARLVELLRVSVRGSAGSAIPPDATLAAAPRVLRAHALLRGSTEVDLRDLRALVTLGMLPHGPLDAVAESERRSGFVAWPHGQSDARVASTRRDGRLNSAPRASATDRARPTSANSSGWAAASEPMQSDVPQPILQRELAHVPTEPGPASSEARLPEHQTDPAIEAWIALFRGQLAARTGRREASRTPHPGGAPRRLRVLRSFAELDDADPVEVVDYLIGRSGNPPRVSERSRRLRLGDLVILRDVSASMQGPTGRWCARLAELLLDFARRSRWRVGYVEFHHAATRYVHHGAFLHRHYATLRDRVRGVRILGQTNFEAPLRALLEGTRRGSPGQAVLITDGLPVIGDPRVIEERRLLAARGWRVHTLFVGHGAVPEVLRGIAADTGASCARIRPLTGGRFRLEEVLR